MKVLDFGCGTGLLTEKISTKGCSVVALDSSEKMIAILKAKELKNVTTIANNLSDTLADTNVHLECCFDLMLASSALAFVKNYPQKLKDLQHLLKPGGHLIQWDWLNDASHSGIGFSREDIKAGMNHAGFNEYSTSIPFAMDSLEGLMPVVMGIGKKEERVGEHEA